MNTWPANTSNEYIVLENDAGSAGFADASAHFKHVTQPCRRLKSRFYPRKHEQDSISFEQLIVVHSLFAQPFGSRPLHEAEVARVIHHALGIRIL